MVVSYLRQKGYVITDGSLDWARFIEEFMLRVEEAKQQVRNNQPLSEDLQEYYRYETNRLRESSELIKGRFEFMLEQFLEEFPSMDRRDPQRLFDEYQKRLIYRRANHRCQDPQDANCAEETAYDEGEAHHIIHWSQGGPTTLENGQWLCRHCNRVKNR